MGKKRKSAERIASRREFLKTMMVGGAGVALAAASGESPAAPEAPAAGRAPPPSGAAGYRETDHVRAYYETAGL